MASESYVDSCHPSCILLFSGKRKTGKDFITGKLMERIGTSDAVIIRISAPIKSHWASKLGLNLDELLGTSEYKEKYRQDMIVWSEEVRATDYGYFCRAALELTNAKEKSVWIVSDVRRRSDLKWFRDNFGDCVKTVRVTADSAVRSERGYVFTSGVDDVASECDLDSVENWDIEIHNNGIGSSEGNDVDEEILSVLQYINQK